MQVEAQASNLYLQAIAGSICDPSEGEVPNALDRDAGQDAEDGEDDKGAEVEQDDEAEDEGWIEEGHLICQGPGAIRDVCCRGEVIQRPRAWQRFLFPSIS